MPKKLHLQVEEYIRSAIASGTHKLGEQIPTENELVEILQVSRPTVRQALNRLTAEGFLVRIKGRGTFVTEPKILHESTTFISGYRAEIQKKSRVLRTKVLALCPERADNSVAQALKITVGSKVIKLVRVRSLDGYNNNAPVVHTTVYVPFALFPEMLTLDFSEASFYDALAEQGLAVRHASRDLEAVMPPNDVVTALGIGTFEPTISIASVGCTESGRPVEYAISHYPAGCSRFHIEVNP